MIVSNSMLEKTEGTIKKGQSRDTGNIWHTKYRTKTNITQKTKTMSNKDLTKTGADPVGAHPAPHPSPP